jgi:hypothetical protein
LGGLLADPVALYPSVFPSDSVWTSYRYLLPNLIIASLQLFTLLLTFFVLQETHPQILHRHHRGLSILHVFKNLISTRGSEKEAVYAPLTNNSASLEAQENTAELHHLEGLQERGQDEARRDSSLENTKPEEPIKATPTQVFTLQIVLQILAVSLLAFHKVSSDSLMGTFLALEAAHSPNDNGTDGAKRDGMSFPLASGGFGFDTRVISIIFLTEAIFRTAIQPTLIPWLISKLGPLGAFRCVLGLYPAMYLLTPFLPSLSSPWKFVALLPDLWIKVALSSVGYICSAIL